LGRSTVVFELPCDFSDHKDDSTTLEMSAAMSRHFLELLVNAPKNLTKHDAHSFVGWLTLGPRVNNIDSGCNMIKDDHKLKPFSAVGFGTTRSTPDGSTTFKNSCLALSLLNELFFVKPNFNHCITIIHKQQMQKLYGKEMCLYDFAESTSASVKTPDKSST
jgi:hypothetical protein